MRLGVVTDLKVSRSREGAYQFQILGWHKRCEAGVEELVRDGFLAGI
jgi:hypothetical protein